MRALRRVILWTLVLALVAPLALIALYRVANPPLTPLMLIRLAEGQPIRKSWRDPARISPHLFRAVIAAEDNKFCEHAGFDLNEMADQLDRWLEGGRPRGASTITMQTAKNLFLWPGRDPLRKGLEAWLTWQIELLWPKRRILEVYVNVVEFGPGLYGAEAAAQAFFSLPASALTAAQGARLAAILPNPLEYAPTSSYASERAGEIIRLIPKLGPLLACIPS